jgi:P27 family predicted phage terminase small subunit
MPQRKHSPELKLLHGVEARERVDTTVKAPGREPRAPSTLSPAERKVWNHVVGELREMGLLTSADLHEIVAYAQTVALANQLHAEITSAKSLVWTNPISGASHPHPLLPAYDHTLARTHALAKALGLNPYARTLIHGRAPVKSDTEAANIPDLYSA